MNCKPGELAIIVKESLLFFQDDQGECDFHFRFPVGTIVKVLKEKKDNFSGNVSNNKIKYHEWGIDKYLNVGVDVVHHVREGIKSYKIGLDYWCPDDVLKPLRGFEDNESRNFSIVKQEEVTA